MTECEVCGHMVTRQHVPGSFSCLRKAGVPVDEARKRAVPVQSKGGEE